MFWKLSPLCQQAKSKNYYKKMKQHKNYDPKKPSQKKNSYLFKNAPYTMPYLPIFYFYVTLKFKIF